MIAQSKWLKVVQGFKSVVGDAIAVEYIGEDVIYEFEDGTVMFIGLNMVAWFSSVDEIEERIKYV